MVWILGQCIEFIRLSIYVIFCIFLCSCNNVHSLQVRNEEYKGKISIAIEQQYWDRFLALNLSSYKSLTPFFYEKTFGVIDQIQYLIYIIGEHHNSVFFAYINSEFNVFYFNYIAWNNDNGIVSYVVKDDLSKKYIIKTYQYKDIPSLDVFKKISDRGFFSDIGNPYLLNGSSIYLTVNINHHFSRFVSYRPMLGAKESSVTPFLFAEYILKLIEKCERVGQLE